MQTYSMDGVRQERTNWRDEKISERHRQWGFDCPAVDIDLLMIEYHLAKPVALTEYKLYRAKTPNIADANYRALIALCELASLPFFVVFYWPDIWAFRVFPINAKAKEHFRSPYQDCSEKTYVATLYRIRYLAIGDTILNKLNNAPVPVQVAAD